MGMGGWHSAGLGNVRFTAELPLGKSFDWLLVATCTATRE